MIQAPSDQLAILADKTRTLVAGGTGGRGGDPGPGGGAGRGGDGGRGDGIWCRDESNNRRSGPGRPGDVGRQGSNGLTGPEGMVVGSPATKETFEQRLQSGQNHMLDDRVVKIEEYYKNA